jgi:RNA polymerase sigma-70 factor (family 1)
VFDEKFIIEKIKSGDKAAFSLVFTTYYSDLVCFANTFLKNPDDSREIVQDVFTNLWSLKNDMVISKSLKSYLLKSVQNDCLDYIRHLAVKNRYSHFVLTNELLYENNTENYILCSELEAQISEALGQMPPDVAEAFKMNRFENLKYHEIADKLNVSIRTIEVRVGKALQLLRVFLKEYLKFLIIFSNLFIN